MKNKFNKRLKLPRIVKSLSNLTEKVNRNPKLVYVFTRYPIGNNANRR